MAYQNNDASLINVKSQEEYQENNKTMTAGVKALKEGHKSFYSEGLKEKQLSSQLSQR